MAKPIPVPDEVDQPFWDAVNQQKLIIQTCTACNRRQYPPEPTCRQCGKADNLEWKETSGRGWIHGHVVQYDTRVVVLKEDQPFNIAIIALEEDPDIKFFSHLPGTPADQVPSGAKVRVVFQEVAPGTYVPEWEVIS